MTINPYRFALMAGLLLSLCAAEARGDVREIVFRPDFQSCGNVSMESWVGRVIFGTVTNISSPKSVLFVPEKANTSILVTLDGVEPLSHDKVHSQKVMAFLLANTLNKAGRVILSNDEHAEIASGASVKGSLVIGDVDVGLYLLKNDMMKYSPSTSHAMSNYQVCVYRQADQQRLGRISYFLEAPLK